VWSTLAEVNHQLESRMRENRPSGSEGGGTTRSPYPYIRGRSPSLSFYPLRAHRPITKSAPPSFQRRLPIASSLHDSRRTASPRRLLSPLRRTSPLSKQTILLGHHAGHTLAAFVLMNARLSCGRELKAAAFVQNSFAFPMSPLP